MTRGNKRLWAAAAVSITAHAALLTGNWLPPAETPPEPPTLSARLEPQPPVKPPPPAAKPRPAVRQPRPAVAAQPLPVEPVIPVPVTETPVPSAEPAPEPVTIASAEPTFFRLPEAPPFPAFPPKGRITYQLTMGPEKSLVGRTVQTWQIENMQYQLGSQSESIGLIEVFKPHRYRYLSQGTLSELGLRPERFLSSIQRGSRTDEALAVFDWENQRITLGRAPQQTTVALPPGSQDIISFMYQLALSLPPPGRIRIPFTRGSRLDLISFDVLAQETIETPLGQLRATPVVQVRQDGQESLAVWLAIDYRNLPVRIRFFSRDGEPAGEQLVSEIQVVEQ